MGRGGCEWGLWKQIHLLSGLYIRYTCCLVYHSFLNLTTPTHHPPNFFTGPSCPWVSNIFSLMKLISLAINMKYRLPFPTVALGALPDTPAVGPLSLDLAVGCKTILLLLVFVCLMYLFVFLFPLYVAVVCYCLFSCTCVKEYHYIQ